MALDEKYAFATIRELSVEIKAGRISPVDLVEMFLGRIERYDPKLLAFITLTPELARAQAKQAETEIRAGNYRGPLHGIPWGVKDIYDTKGIRSTWGSPIYKDRIPLYDATTVVRLREAGAVLMGKLGTGEFAGGAKDLLGDVRNPWKLDRTASGSSAGPGSATAGGLVVFALGTDTGGSIMGPSGSNGVTGMVPTMGRVSRYGVMTLCWSLDKCGPLCRTADDVGLVLHAIAGPDPNDFTCRDAPFSYSEPTGIVKGMKVGVVRAEFEPAEKAGTKPLFDAALNKMTELGVHLEDVELQDFPYAEVNGVINIAEAADQFEDLIRGGRIDEFASPERGIKWFAGLSVLAVDYIRAQRVRTDIIEYAKSIFMKYDALIAPNNVSPAALVRPSGGEATTGATAPRAGGNPAAGEGRRNLGSLCSISGVTYISTRCGFHDGLPICVKLVSAPFEELKIIRLAHAYEQATEWNAKTPQFLA
jgi:aspartyl-tRNA(Asn)/glutamyl-tRNA(Gln) amidotransferase subunit A